ncbi:MAG: AbrB/MazE/SpoVT family DNA-binding domain-containing protein [Firmicutes bacterium]|nr:AbrB/MazE/SpoVT family DNA-binding domain-containing protein [Bacillota bacterium]
MISATIKVSSKRQITVPSKIAKALKIEPGSQLLLELKGNKVILTPKPTSYTERFSGVLHSIYGDEKEIKEYVQEERTSWER